MVAAKVFGKPYGSLIPIRVPGQLMILMAILMEAIGKTRGEIPFINRTKIAESLAPAQSVSNAKAKQMLGWRPTESIVSMMVKAGKWYKNHGMI